MEIPRDILSETNNNHLVELLRSNPSKEAEEYGQGSLAFTLATDGEMTTESESSSQTSNASEDSLTQQQHQQQEQAVIIEGTPQPQQEPQQDLKETSGAQDDCEESVVEGEASVTEEDIDSDHKAAAELETAPPSSSNSSNSSSAKRRSSILKLSPEPLHIKESKSAWKCLGKPNMDMVRSVSDCRRRDYESYQFESNSAMRRSHSVVFGSVQIRNYSQTLGDNPSVSYGPPISLDWDYDEDGEIALDSYEDNRKPRRSLRQMVLSYYHRKNVLEWQYGFSEDVLDSAKKTVQKERFRREITRAFLPIMHVEAAIESAGRKTMRLFGKKKKQKEDKDQQDQP